jgi:peptide/nickel transport system substrate-binding protein
MVISGAAASSSAACGQAPAAAPKAEAPKPAADAPKPTVAPAVVVPTAPPAQQAAAPTAAPKPTEAPKPAAQPTVKRGGIMKVQTQNDWSTMDLHLSQTGVPESPLVFDFLTKLERNASGAFEVKPSLAESWELADPQTVVFKLRKGVKFHDGSDLDAAVVKWNFERVLNHPKSTSKSQLAAVEAIDVVDPSTLRLKLKAPSPTLFVNLTSDARYIGIMSKAHHDKVGDEGVARQPVGTGPFKLAEWRPGSSVFYKKFDGYWKQGADGKPLPYPDEIQVYVQPDPSVALAQMRSSELDLMTVVLGKDLPTIKGNANLVHTDAPWQATTYCLCFNARPGSRFEGEKMKKVRQAAWYAIDRDSMAKALGLGLGEPTGYILAPGQIAYSESTPKYTFDHAKAKQLMAEAGFAEGLDVTLDYISRPEDQQNAQLYQQMLGQVGIRITLQPQERVAWVQKTGAGNFEFAAFQTGAPRPDSDLTLTAYYGSKGPSGWTGLADPEIDKALEEGRTTYDMAKRVAAYTKVQTLVYENAYVGFSWRRNGGYVTSKATRDFGFPYLSMFTNSTEVWLDR